jgi:hypothetical protein
VRIYRSQGDRHWLVLADGSEVDEQAYWLEALDRRSERGGYVSLCSGRDGMELKRVEGGVPGHAFGDRVRPAGDVDHDGTCDLLIGSDCLSPRNLQMVSGATAEVLYELANNGGPFGAAGDADGDGVGDLFLAQMNHDRRSYLSAVTILSGTEPRALFELAYPDIFGDEYSVTVPLGDIDGDETPDFMLGNANFHIHESRPKDSLRGLTLERALALQSAPWCAFTWESGAAWVYSGRTRQVIMGVWGDPGSRQGMGLNGSPVPDLDGDGWPEIAVVDGKGAHVFAGPGLDSDK